MVVRVLKHPEVLLYRGDDGQSFMCSLPTGNINFICLSLSFLDINILHKYILDINPQEFKYFAQANGVRGYFAQSN